ncbi:MAG: hypothetical protein Q9159_004899 [Coniocarpon cinnabarinum]
MSLRPDDGHSHSGKSRSRSRDDRGRSHGAVRFENEADPAQKPKKPSKSARFADESTNGGSPAVSMPSMPEIIPESPHEAHAYGAQEPSNTNSHRSSSEESDSDEEPTRHGKRPLRRSQSDDVRSYTSAEPSRRKHNSRLSDDLAYGETEHDRESSGVPYPEGDAFGVQYPDDDSPLTPRARMPSVAGWSGYAAPGPFRYEKPEPYKYAEPPDEIKYKAQPELAREYRHTAEPAKPKMPVRTVSFPQEYTTREARPDEEPRYRHSNRLSVEGHRTEKRAPSPAGRLAAGMNRLSVNTGHGHDVHEKIGVPPASPLLESYHGTYQSISPMPSPIMLAQTDDHDGEHSSDSISDVDLDVEDTTRHAKAKAKMEAKAKKKRVKLYDAEGDAEKIAAALDHREARPGPLIDILPELTHDQLLALRGEYKKRVKIQGKGVNLAKQIKALTSGNFSKVCYATALGRWESEAYWANFWYQARSTNRELLIESLMGRSNADIREIKEGFRDKRYHDDLSLCMQKELKPDKFRTAVLMALEGDRQEETDIGSPEERSKDVERLYRALKSREGGETAILEIVVTRSNNHLREVLRTFEKVHRENLAKAALKKSGNLVVSSALFSTTLQANEIHQGEVIAHILNGVINGPARDCLLLRHAINDVTLKEGDLRYELLMSRLIRLHWDRSHLAKVKEDYKNKYGETLERGVKKATKGDFGAFCVRLCETQ